MAQPQAGDPQAVPISSLNLEQLSTLKESLQEVRAEIIIAEDDLIVHLGSTNIAGFIPETQNRTEQIR